MAFNAFGLLIVINPLLFTSSNKTVSVAVQNLLLLLLERDDNVGILFLEEDKTCLETATLITFYKMKWFAMFIFELFYVNALK